MVLAALATTAALAASAQAATYTVGMPSDLNGACEPASGTCSLRQLIEYENAAKPAEPDAIVVPSGKYNLTHGALVITQPVVIVGAGARTTVVDEPEGISPGERVFDVRTPSTGGSVSVGIVGLEVSGGTANEEFGGDILNFGDLVLSEDWITAGNAEFGGAVANEAGTLVIENSLVSGNHASSGSGNAGGVENLGIPGTEDKPGTLAILNSTIAANDARVGGGILSSGDATNKTHDRELHDRVQQQPRSDRQTRRTGSRGGACLRRGHGAGRGLDHRG